MQSEGESLSSGVFICVPGRWVDDRELRGELYAVLLRRKGQMGGIPPTRRRRCICVLAMGISPFWPEKRYYRMLREGAIRARNTLRWGIFGCLRGGNPLIHYYFRASMCNYPTFRMGKWGIRPRHCGPIALLGGGHVGVRVKEKLLTYHSALTHQMARIYGVKL